MYLRSAFLTTLLLVSITVVFTSLVEAATDKKTRPVVSEGKLVRAGIEDEPLQLQSTEVKMSIVGFVASVSVQQTFLKPYKENIEAIYIFPLPGQAAVDDVQITILVVVIPYV